VGGDPTELRERMSRVTSLRAEAAVQVGHIGKLRGTTRELVATLKELGLGGDACLLNVDDVERRVTAVDELATRHASDLQVSAIKNN